MNSKQNYFKQQIFKATGNVFQDKVKKKRENWPLLLALEIGLY